MRNEHFIAVACDVHGAEMANGVTGDCIGVVIDESLVFWDGWDALYSIRVYHVTNDEDGNEVSEVVHEEYAKPQVILD